MSDRISKQMEESKNVLVKFSGSEREKIYALSREIADCLHQKEAVICAAALMLCAKFIEEKLEGGRAQ